MSEILEFIIYSHKSLNLKNLIIFLLNKPFNLFKMMNVNQMVSLNKPMLITDSNLLKEITKNTNSELMSAFYKVIMQAKD